MDVPALVLLMGVLWVYYQVEHSDRCPLLDGLMDGLMDEFLYWYPSIRIYPVVAICPLVLFYKPFRLFQQTHQVGLMGGCPDASQAEWMLPHLALLQAEVMDLFQVSLQV